MSGSWEGRGAGVDYVSSLAWAPDGARIAFSAGGDIRTVALATGETTTLVEGAGEPAWSPDGRRIAFVRGYRLCRMLFCPPSLVVYVAAADGSNPRALSPGTADEFSPAWSPGDDRIAYVSAPAGETELGRWSLVIADADGGGTLRQPVQGLPDRIMLSDWR